MVQGTGNVDHYLSACGVILVAAETDDVFRLARTPPRPTLSSCDPHTPQRHSTRPIAACLSDALSLQPATRSNDTCEMLERLIKNIARQQRHA